MKIDFKKLYYKLFDFKKYKDHKILLKKQNDIKIFKEKFEDLISNIQKKIKEKNELSFLHSGHSGDIINSLPTIKELSKTHKCNLYIQINKSFPPNLTYFRHTAGNVFINEKIFNMLLPLLKSQKYLYKVEKYETQNIDINFDTVRDLPNGLNFDNARWGFNITGVRHDLIEPYLSVNEHESIKNKIVIHRTFRYRNYFINYRFLNNYKNLLFIGIQDEYKDLKKEINNIEFHYCKDFLEMAKIINASKFFIGNQSVGYDLAEALKIPRLLEGCPSYPVIKPHGKNAHDFFFQPHFEKWCEYLNNKGS